MTSFEGNVGARQQYQSVPAVEARVTVSCGGRRVAVSTPFCHDGCRTAWADAWAAVLVLDS